MRGIGLTLYGSVLASTLAAAIAMAQGSDAALRPTGLAAEGDDIFAATCGNQYCHGPGGRGAQGPKLAGSGLSPEVIRKTIMEGKPGTAMAGFKGVLDPHQLDAVIAYAQFIASGRKAAASAASGADPALMAAGKPRAAPPPPAPQSPGEALFFDSNNPHSCRSCHSYNKRGGPLGVDFAQAGLTRQQVRAALTTPHLAAPAYPGVTVILANGEQVRGVRVRQTADAIQLYDPFLPPVRRTFAMKDVKEVRPETRGVFDHTRLGYGKKEIDALVEALGGER
jgi:mono/diheme cytochrome c family protein